MQKFYKPHETPNMYNDDTVLDRLTSDPVIIYLKSGEVRLARATRMLDTATVVWYTEDSEQYTINQNSIRLWTHLPPEPINAFVENITQLLNQQDANWDHKGEVRNCKYIIHGGGSPNGNGFKMHLTSKDAFNTWEDSTTITVNYYKLFAEEKINIDKAVENLVSIFDRG